MHLNFYLDYGNIVFICTASLGQDFQVHVQALLSTFGYERFEG